MTEKTKQNLIWTALGLTAAVSLYFICVLGLWIYAHDRAYPGVTVAGISVAGKSQSEIESLIAEKAAEMEKADLIFTAGKPVTVNAATLGVKADLLATARGAVSWGEGNPFVIGRKADLPIVYTADQALLNKTILSVADKNTSTATDPSLTLSGNDLVVKDGISGKRVNLAETETNFYKSLGQGNPNVTVAAFTIYPSFAEGEATAQKEAILKATASPLTLSANSQKFVVSQSDQVGLIGLSGTVLPEAYRFHDDPLFYPLVSPAEGGLFSAQKVASYLTALSGKINRNPKNAELTVSGGKVVVAQADVNGQTLDIGASTIAVLDALESSETEADLAIETQKPEVRADNLASLGLNELISSGRSNFSGSPRNRIHNVRTGASKFDGVLIRPGEEFSFNTRLGPVDASTGYLPELVILEDKTVPEYGGGMCQVSSTAFRAALNAGLPILERLYHAYPVTYYKPYGVDATVYLPKPDLVFKNDTGNYILIQTYISGYNLTFDFYGTKMPRTVTFAGNAEAKGAVPVVERVSPYIYEQGKRGKGSFTAAFWRFIYDVNGGLIKKSSWVSKYDSPDKYPH